MHARRDTSAAHQPGKHQQYRLRHWDPLRRRFRLVQLLPVFRHGHLVQLYLGLLICVFFFFFFLLNSSLSASTMLILGCHGAQRHQCDDEMRQATSPEGQPCRMLLTDILFMHGVLIPANHHQQLRSHRIAGATTHHHRPPLSFLFSLYVGHGSFAHRFFFANAACIESVG